MRDERTLEKGWTSMDKMLAIVVANEKNAYEALRTLKELDEYGSISIYAEALIQRNADNTIARKRLAAECPVDVAGSTAIDAVIRFLEGAVGPGIGSTAGGLAGSFRDLYVAGVSAAFIDDLVATLTPGRFAVIADISEEWTIPVDVRMETIGGTVLRSSKKSVEAEQRAKEIARLRAEIEQAKAELARAHADRKAKLQAGIDRLSARLQAQFDEAEQRSAEIKIETEAKVRALEKKAEKARGDAKAALDAQIRRIRQDYEATDAKLRQMLAERLRSAAARLKKE
jgi:uncharacterized membrane protein